MHLILLALPFFLPAQNVVEAAADTGAARAMTPWDVARLRSVVDVALSPDGEHVAYLLAIPRTEDEDDGSSWTELHVVPFDGGDSRAYVTGKGNVGSIAWRPGTNSISFRQKRGDDKHSRVWLLPIDGGEAQPVTPEGEAAGSYKWSPDGSRLAWTKGAEKGKEVKAREKAGHKQIVYEEDWRHTNLRLFTPGEDESVEVELGMSVQGFEWSPDGTRLALALTPTPLIDDSYMSKSIWIVDAAAPFDARPAVANNGKMESFGWASDGSAIVVQTALDIHDPAASQVAYVKIQATDGRAVGVGDPGWNWVTDNAMPATTAQAGAGSEPGSAWWLQHTGFTDEVMFAELDETGAGEAQPMWGGLGSMRSVELDSVHHRAVFLASTPNHPFEAFAYSHDEHEAGGRPRRLTNANPWLSECELGSQSVITWKSRPDNGSWPIEGLLLTPRGWTAADGPLPTIVVVHGGPESNISNGWVTNYSYPGHMATGAGYAVLMPNYRASTGYGVAFAKANQKDQAGAEFDDIVDGVRHLIAEGIADPDRIGVTGGSYGGYATAWMATYYSDVFAAGVMFVGISDFLSKVGTTDIPLEMELVHATERISDGLWVKYLERSPIYHVNNARTPLLIMHGKDDPRVSPTQSMEMHRHLKLKGDVPVRLVLYPGEGHGNRKRSNRLDYNLRMMRWFDAFLVEQRTVKPPIEVDYAEPGSEPVEASADLEEEGR